MARTTLLVAVLACLLKISVQRSTPQDDSYVAAVIEFEVTRNSTAAMGDYIRYIREAAEQNADIMVFPEMTLTRGEEYFTVPINSLLKESPIPAMAPELYDDGMVAISRAARENQIYVVVNVQERVDCTIDAPGEDCPEQKVYLFNTNVVFDRTGAVIDRYRKINLFGEVTRTPALDKYIGFFETDFGVKFGHFICFDLMFQIPAIQVVEKKKISDVIFTTMWFSEMPYLTAVQIQEAYAYRMNVNFLAAGANNVGIGSAGSGIYSGKAGALVSTMPGVPTTRLLVARVPKVPGQVTGTYPGPIYDSPEDHDSLILITDPSFPSHVSRELVNGFNEFTITDKEVSCHFTVRLNQTGGDVAHKYRAYVTDGINIYSMREMAIAACAVVACKDDKPSSCVYKFGDNERNVEIQELKIEMDTFGYHYNSSLQCDDIVYFPMSATNKLHPLKPENFTFVDAPREGGEKANGDGQQNGGRANLSMKLNAPQDNLVSFALYGRVYNKDVNRYSVVITEESMHQFIELENRIYRQYKYRAAAFSGVRSFSGMASGGSRICALVACTGDTIDTCGKRFPTYTKDAGATFDELTIVATMPTPIFNTTLSAQDSEVFPLSLSDSIMPLALQDYTFIEDTRGESTIYTFTLNNHNVQLYTFSVWGRVFGWDGEEASPPVPGSSSVHLLYKLLLPVAALISYAL